jgi:hypothetical protein
VCPQAFGDEQPTVLACTAGDVADLPDPGMPQADLLQRAHENLAGQ